VVNALIAAHIAQAEANLADVGDSDGNTLRRTKRQPRFEPAPDMIRGCSAM